MNRFFVGSKQVKENIIEITGKDVKHIKNVLRLKPKDTVEIISEGKHYTCQISNIFSDKVEVLILDSYNGKNESPIDIVLFQGIAKGSKMDLIIQKGTEIGIKEFYPLVTKRTVVKIKDSKKEKNKINRWSNIAEEASKQSKRDIIPLVNNVVGFDKMIDILKEEKNIIIPYEMENSYGLKKALKKIRGERVNLIIGPEGGFEKEEIQALKDIGGQVITLGNRILRTETAGIVTASIILYELGDLGVIM
ncbi:16S rRNA (uracil(1498)-N(3))-methyltransferase [Schnuerera sp. xch1]|uniref:16S rRNA (uracil(1498)-N(3))-methyltransferase n=1 Tax=Schnuerera sp. xch1 TaxID=2874283 RepID=UPI001CBAD42D|nr:16S rRNA (uracil(1498)-N(3))-methyltransferase [Schnuerera sp. xch1]MBZ2175739.1 16S rRNA (uracil(1498)-N(3))-methyltransferase [Schnuerera sp. xch1]